MKYILLVAAGSTITSSVIAAELNTIIENSSGWGFTIGMYSKILIDILGPTVLSLAILLAYKLKVKIGVQSSKIVEDLLTSIVKKAINYANAWSANQSNNPKGEAKLQMALIFAGNIVNEHKLQKVAEEKLVALIEAQLYYDKHQDG